MTRKPDKAQSTIAQNKKARFDYFIEERIEAGLALEGWEVKSMRAGKAQIAESYVILRERRSVAARLSSHAAQHCVDPRARRIRRASASCS